LKFPEQRRLQPFALFATTCSHAASGCKWLQVAAHDASDAAWTANTSPNGPTRENLKKKAFLANCIFSSFL